MTLPIEQALPALLAAVRDGQNFVLVAEPGAGKTTRVPPALLDAGLVEGEILVAQPRRIAARLAARRVAEELREPVGERCGYQVRFDRKVGPSTRIRFVTEGLLARRIRDDPSLEGVGIVILDEFHERHLDTDVGLALLRRIQRTRRPDLRIGVMSATLRADPIAEFLDAVSISCPGRTFPIELEYQPTSDRSVDRRVNAAFRDLLEAEIDGDVLVFLPGASEIRASQRACQGLAEHHSVDIEMLHGDLSAADQDRAVRGGPRRRLILSTNVAETSVTVANVAAVIDSGLVRRPSHNPWTSIPMLELAKISRASAEQRAGRAGRVRAGKCIRLYSQHDLERRPAFDAPELARLDLARVMVDLRCAGLRSANELDWLEAPPAAGIEAAERLLQRLGALETDGTLSKTGRELATLPVHPRLARILVEGRRRGVGAETVGIAALLSERSIWRRSMGDGPRRATTVSAADVFTDLEALWAFEREGASFARREGLDIGACKMALRVQRQLARSKSGPKPGHALDEATEQTLGLCLLCGFADRLGRLRTHARGGREIVFAEGGSAELAPESAIDGTLAIALAAEERRQGAHASKTVVRSAASIEPEWILELFEEELVERRSATFDPKKERVNVVEELVFGELVIEQSIVREPSDEAAEVLREAALAKGADAFVKDAARLANTRNRLLFASKHDPAIEPLDDAALQRALGELCVGARSFADIRKTNLLEYLLSTLPASGRTGLERLAPQRVKLRGGRSLDVHYEADRDPWVQSRLQDFFGELTGPTVASGRTPLVLHLLAPNQRAVQVTTDLEGFWDRHYPALRKTLMRRYPRHDWPEDPRTATPSKPRPRRRRS